MNERMLNKLAFRVPESKKVRYLIHTDCKNEADDQFTVAHCLMTQMMDVKGIVAAHFENNMRGVPKGTTVHESFREVEKILDLMEIKGEYPVLLGADRALPDEMTPVDSEGARFIIAEAMKEDERPLFIGCQGSLTDLASAILIEPEIVSKMTAIWIGGGPYPNGGDEFNLSQDIAAANVVMKSAMPLWQVPQNMYKKFNLSLAELQLRVKPCGKIGEYLFRQLIELNEELGDKLPDFTWPHGELWGLGDEGVVAALLNEKQHEDIYRMVPAPEIEYGTMNYIHTGKNREIRVFHEMDVRLTIEDLISKLSILYK